MDHETRLKRIRFRAWHRGTREADYLVGGYFDAHHRGWGEAELAWFEALMEEQDADILGWAMGSIPCPAAWRGPLMERLQALDFVKIV
jgi:antitoxin CptB